MNIIEESMTVRIVKEQGSVSITKGKQDVENAVAQAFVKNITKGKTLVNPVKKVS